MTASEMIQPLDLKYIFGNVLSGSQLIWMGLFFIAMCVLAGLFRMSEKTFLLLMALSSILLYGWFGGGFFILVVIIAGSIIFLGISRLVKN